MEEDSSRDKREHHPLSYSKEKAGKIAVQHKNNHSTLVLISHTVLILLVVLRTN